jgi:hypothetical protein
MCATPHFDMDKEILAKILHRLIYLSVFMQAGPFSAVELMKGRLTQPKAAIQV